MKWQSIWINNSPPVDASFGNGQKHGLYASVDMTKVNWDKLSKYTKQYHLTHIQLDPNNTANDFTIPVDLVDQYDFKRTIPLFLRHTVVIDISQPDLELESAMHPKTRYNLRLAQKKG